MKAKLFLHLLFVGTRAFSQTEINKTIAFQPGQTITMHFDYPELIKVSTWDKNEISITGTVTINGNSTLTGGVVADKLVINGNGNELDNELNGNSSANVLDGKSGKATFAENDVIMLPTPK